jgi:mono/diheme cytochrome c family protein
LSRLRRAVRGGRPALNHPRTAAAVVFALVLAAGGGPVPGSVPAAGAQDSEAQDATVPSGEAGTAAPAEATAPGTEAAVPATASESTPETAPEPTPEAAAGEDGAGEAATEAPAPEAAPSEAAPVVEAEAPAPAPPPPPKPAVDWKAVANPVPADAASIERGKALYGGKGFCNVCHGDKGDGFGPVAAQFDPLPNAFFEADWQGKFTDGELMGVLQEGKFGTGMIPLVPEYMTEAEGWDVINYVRTLQGKTSETYERAKALRLQSEEELRKLREGEQP